MIADVVSAVANVAAPAIAVSVPTPITRTPDWLVAFPRAVENYLDLTRWKREASLLVKPPQTSAHAIHDAPALLSSLVEQPGGE